MKIKQFLFCASLICATCVFAEDSYLLWFVDPTATFDGGKLADAEAFKGKDVSAKISYFQSGKPAEWVYGGGNYLTIYADDYGIPASSGAESISVNDFNSQYFAGIPTGGDGLNWTYFVELYNDSGIFAHSDAFYPTADSIVSLAGMGKPGTTWNVTAFVPAAVPEPNSALLMLIGCAALALRRRKQVAA